MTSNDEREIHPREHLSEKFLSLNQKDQEVIIFLYEWNRPIRVGDIREYLPYPHSTLNSVIKRLQKEDIVEWEAYGIVRLKHIGREMAAHQLDHHGIIHQYFLQELALTDEEAHEESMRIAGIISCHTVIKMMEKLPKEMPNDCSLILDKV